MWEVMQANPVLAWPLWVHHISQVSHLMTVLSCSTNFYIYMAKHGQLGVRSCPFNSDRDQQVIKNMSISVHSMVDVPE